MLLMKVMLASYWMAFSAKAARSTSMSTVLPSTLDWFSVR